MDDINRCWDADHTITENVREGMKKIQKYMDIVNRQNWSLFKKEDWDRIHTDLNKISKQYSIGVDFSK